MPLRFTLPLLVVELQAVTRYIPACAADQVNLTLSTWSSAVVFSPLLRLMLETCQVHSYYIVYRILLQVSHASEGVSDRRGRPLGPQADTYRKRQLVSDTRSLFPSVMRQQYERRPDPCDHSTSTSRYIIDAAAAALGSRNTTLKLSS